MSESLYDILRKICDHLVVTLQHITLEHIYARNSRWYNESEFFHFHRQKGNDTNRCRTLQHNIQNLIDKRKL